MDNAAITNQINRPNLYFLFKKINTKIDIVFKRITINYAISQIFTNSIL